MTPEQFVVFANPLPEAMLLLTSKGVVLACNRATEARLDIKCDDLTGQRLADLVADPSEEVAQYLRNCARSRQLVFGSVRIRGSGGEELPFRCEGARVVESPEGSEPQLLLRMIPKSTTTKRFVELNRQVEALHKEIERRRAAEEAIRDRESWLRVTVNSIGDGVIVTDPEGRVVLLNPVAEELTGWRTEEAAGVPLEDVFHIVNETTRATVENPAIRALRDGVIVGLANHTILIAKDGVERPIDDSAAPIRDDDGDIHGAVLIFRDVTERRGVEQRLRIKARLLDTVGQAVIVTDQHGTITFWNHYAESLYGWSKEEAIGSPVITRTVAHDQIDTAGEILDRLKEGEPWSGEFHARRKNGATFPAHVTNTPLLDDEGNLTAIIGISIDISEQKRVEQALRFLSDASATLADVVDYESTLQKVAGLSVPHFADWCAVDMVEQDGTTRRLAVVHSDPAKVQIAEDLNRLYPPPPGAPHSLSAVLRTGQPQLLHEISSEMLAQIARGPDHLRMLQELAPRSYMCVPLRGRRGTIGGMTFVSAESGRHYTRADLDFAQEVARRAAIAIENSQLYAELRDTDRRKDEFLATLAHELRNPLAPICNALQVLKMPRIDAATTQQTTEMMERQTRHLVRLVDDLLDVSRVMRGKVELRREQVELATIVARAVETVKSLMEVHKHQLEIKFPKESMLLDADPVRLVQVVGNLLTNAAKYTEPGGQITLTAVCQDNEAVLTVADNGIGIAPHMLSQVFELFVQADHTTNRAQGGLGIGLTLVKNLVELHGGTVDVFSTGLHEGSQFTVRLPLLQPATGSAGDADVADNQATNIPTGHRLLVVDDNRDAAVSLAMLLRFLGNEVHVAHDGPAALELAESVKPAMVFLDLGMPGMDGFEVARRLRESHHLSGVVIAALTGWGQQEDRRRTAEGGFDHHLVKPPDPQLLKDLLAALR